MLAAVPCCRLFVLQTETGFNHESFLARLASAPNGYEMLQLLLLVHKPIVRINR
jgi:hypothetical protein